jgi:hypothetical protein
MADDQTAPATKEDIQMLLEQFGKMYDVQERWKNELHKDMEIWKEELKDHFDLAVEQIRHELVSANREEIEVLKDGHNDHGARIIALEKVTGLAA